jgi:hypothetical protein
MGNLLRAVERGMLEVDNEGNSLGGCLLRVGLEVDI